MNNDVQKVNGHPTGTGGLRIRLFETLQKNSKSESGKFKATIWADRDTLWDRPGALAGGINLEKLRNLEDDIALVGLAGLGISNYSHHSGKGTIGYRVPNKTVSLSRTAVLGTEKFMKSDKDLPMHWGKLFPMKFL